MVSQMIVRNGDNLRVERNGRNEAQTVPVHKAGTLVCLVQCKIAINYGSKAMPFIFLRSHLVHHTRGAGDEMCRHNVKQGLSAHLQLVSIMYIYIQKETLAPYIESFVTTVATVKRLHS